MATLQFPDHLLGTSDETYEPMQQENAPRVRVSKFGDGYEQRVRDGINHDLDKWVISFTKRSGVDIDGVYDFLKARGGDEAFQWTPRGESTPRIFVCRKWTRKFDHYNVVQGISFSLEEVAESGVSA
jgi:phage-related protein